METPFLYLHALSLFFWLDFASFPQRPCVHYTELFFGLVRCSLTKPTQIVDIFYIWMDFDILLLFVRRPGQVFTARQIYEAVATDSFDASWTGISSMIYKLRRKLGTGIIETVRGHGYKFCIKNTAK